MTVALISSKPVNDHPLELRISEALHVENARDAEQDALMILGIDRVVSPQMIAALLTETGILSACVVTP